MFLSLYPACIDEINSVRKVMLRNSDLTFEGNATYVKLTIEPDACDMMGTWRPDSTLTAMQSATHYGRENLGIGCADLLEKGKLWVVSRVNITLKRIPRLGEELTVQAFALPAVKLLFPWKFLFVDKTGETIGEGSSVWNLMDASSRRVSYVPGIAEKIPAQAGLCRTELPKAAAELLSPPKKNALRPVYTDLDINGHVNHVHYMDWCCNAMGISVLQHYAVDSFCISFMQEIRPDAMVDTELRIEDKSFSFSGYNAESPAFILNGTLMKR